MDTTPISPKSYGIAVTLSMIFGVLGFHHFYMGNWLHGLLDFSMFVIGIACIASGDPTLVPIGTLLILVVYEERQDRARYHMLETVRDYCRRRLLRPGSATAARRRHLAYFLPQELGKHVSFSWHGSPHEELTVCMRLTLSEGRRVGMLSGFAA